MKLTVNKSHIEIFLNEELNIDEITCFYCGEEEIKFSKSSIKDTPFISIHFLDISIYKECFFIHQGEKISIGKILEPFRLSLDKLEDEFYITSLLINAASRTFSQDELFFVAYNAISVIDTRNHFFGAMLTLLSYRIIDCPDEREWAVNIVTKEKLTFDKVDTKMTPNRARWLISSSSIVGMLLLLFNRVSDAEEIIYNTINNSTFIFNQLSLWNYCQCLILSAMILTYHKRNYEAGWQYLKAFDFSRKSIIDLYHPRNEWILGQMSDCRALMGLGELSLQCASKSLKEIPAESRIKNLNYSGKVSFNIIFDRVREARKKFSNNFFSEVEHELNNMSNNK